jgi:hypothetical protein
LVTLPLGVYPADLLDLWVCPTVVLTKVHNMKKCRILVLTALMFER